jgi:hypothetical protein
MIEQIVIGTNKIGIFYKDDCQPYLIDYISENEKQTIIHWFLNLMQIQCQREA